MKNHENLSSFNTMEIKSISDVIENNGENVIHFEIGDPDFDTPMLIREEAISAILRNMTHYTNSMGILQLREAICQYYWNTFSVPISPDQVMITAGCSQAFLYLMIALISTDDEVIINGISYPGYPNFIRVAHGKPVHANVSIRDAFKIDPVEIKKAIRKNTKAVIINSPCNPTGSVMKKDDYESLVENVGTYIISDEIYQNLVYKGKPRTILEFTPKAFVINGFSKIFAMTGWRIGYLIFPIEFLYEFKKIQSSLSISVNSYTQYAALTAIKDCWPCFDAMKNEYNRRRIHMIDSMKNIGFNICGDPCGAFYIFAKHNKLNLNSNETVKNILNETHVALSPGTDYGPQGEGYLRFSYTTSTENIDTGIRRINNYILNHA
jgi:aspartate/methionine/tyrosine aminotransferase